MTSPLAVDLQQVSLRYGSINALDSVSFEVAVGQKVALVGPSGAGKSSLLRSLSGQVDVSTGRVQALGADVTDLRGRSGRRLRSRIGVIAQAFDLALPLRVVHNVNAGQLGRWSSLASLWSLLRPRTDGAQEVLDLVGLKGRVWARTDELSGGERQRVAIARVLLQSPDLLLADEPTASVDPKLADDMMRLLCAGDHTLVVSAHDPQLARRHVDRIVGMRSGSIVLDRAAADVDDQELATFYDQ